MTKVSACDGKGTSAYCVARSKILRTTRLGAIFNWMGHGCDATDPGWLPPADAEIIMAYYRRMMARQRWTKATSALSALKAMNMAGKGALFGGAPSPLNAAAAAPPPRADPEDSPSAAAAAAPRPPAAAAAPPRPGSPPDTPVPARVSDSSRVREPRRLAPGAARTPVGRLPKFSDVRAFLRELEGEWCFAIVDASKDLVLAARSETCQAANLFAAVAADGTVYVGDEPGAMPEDAAAFEFPRGTFFCGRCAGNGDDDVVFRRFAPDEEADADGEGEKGGGEGVE